MTPAQYASAVALLEKRNPGEPLLPTLRRGHSRVNEVYLRAAMRRVAPAGAVTETPPVTKRETRYADQVLQGLWRERTQLFGEMNKRSNHFHECSSDDDRKANSRDIRRIWGEIQRVKEKIEYYEQFGELPAPVDEERFPIPENPVEMVRKLNSIRASISQTKKRLDDLAALPDGHPDRVKIPEYEAKLKDHQLHAGHVQNAIERARIHAG